MAPCTHVFTRSNGILENRGVLEAASFAEPRFEILQRRRLVVPWVDVGNLGVIRRAGVVGRQGKRVRPSAAAQAAGLCSPMAPQGALCPVKQTARGSRLPNGSRLPAETTAADEPAMSQGLEPLLLHVYHPSNRSLSSARVHRGTVFAIFCVH